MLRNRFFADGALTPVFQDAEGGATGGGATGQAGAQGGQQGVQGGAPPGIPAELQGAVADIVKTAVTHALASAKPAEDPAGKELAELLKAAGVKSAKELSARLKAQAKEAGQTPDGYVPQTEVQRMIEEREAEARKVADSARSQLEALHARMARAEIAAAASKLNFFDQADAALRLGGAVRVSATTGELEVIDAQTQQVRLDYGTGKPMTVEALVAELAKAAPHLVRGANREGAGSGSSPATGGGAPTFTRAQLADPAFYQAHRAEIAKAIADGRIKD
jgi:hypothetical protein